MSTDGRFQRLTFLLLCGLCLLAGNAFAADRVLNASQLDHAPVSLTDYFAILEDSAQTLTLADVQKPEFASRFKTDLPASEGVSFGYTNSAYWLRLTLQNPGAQPLERMLEIGYSRIGHLQFHQPDKDGGYQSLTTGNALPFATRPYQNHNFVFPVTLPAHTVQVYYLRLQSTTPIIVPARLWAPQTFHKYERNDYIGQTWYFGMATAMLLFNLLLFIALLDIIYLSYVFLVASTAFALAAQNGLLKEFLWLDSPLWSTISTNGGFALAIGALLLLMRHMLTTWAIFPRLDRWLKLLIGIYLLTPIGFATIAYQHIVKPTILLNSVTMTLILGIGVYCAVKRQRSAYFFLAAFSMLCIAGVVISLRAYGVVPSNIFTDNALHFGSAIQMLLLAFALADRFTEIRREKAKAQRETLIAQQHLVDSLKSSERLLEERVAQRTAALSESNNALSVANSELERLSVTDRLTGLYNRLRLDKVLEEEMSRSQRYASNFALVLLDIDKFKSVNDTYGHAVGDQVLVAIANLLAAGTRDVDVVGRWGGEEFLIICRDTGLDGAMAMAEKLRQTVAEHVFPVVGNKTSSFGVTSFKEGDTIPAMMERADSALYRAKETGRNRVVCGDSD